MAAPSKEQFLADLNEETFCGYQWCKKLYGYSICDKDFPERVLSRLDELGRERVRFIYGLFVKWEIAYWLNVDKGCAGGVRERIDKNYERQVKECRKDLHKLSDSELLMKLQETRQARQWH